MKLGSSILKSTVQKLSDKTSTSITLYYLQMISHFNEHIFGSYPPTSPVSTTMMYQQTTMTIYHYNTDRNYTIMNL
jgi:hypothetical protein